MVEAKHVSVYSLSLTFPCCLSPQLVDSPRLSDLIDPCDLISSAQEIFFLLFSF